jgi:MazG family protein
MHTRKEKLEAFGRLLDIMDELREKCPWDKAQTIESLRNLTIEETYELAEAISNNEMTEIKKELGDLMLHIVFYSKIGAEKEIFDIADVLNSINKKLIFRHPHVFGDVKVKDARNVEENWEEIKMKEGNKSVLGGVPSGLPSMIKANRIQEKVRAVGFDWDKREQIWDKVNEELQELKQVIELSDEKNIVAEFGDLLFSIINAARLYDVDPESALEITNRKFIKRFKYLEKETIQKGKNLRIMSLDEMNEIWEEAKKWDD